jgi:cytidine deaminase
MSNVPSEAELISLAETARACSYSPYSRFAVGAVAVATDGSTFVGTNVENASFGLTNCAERSAIFAGVAAGMKRFETMLILVGGDRPAAPCGACRQVLFEFGVRRIISVAGDVRKEWTLAELLPDAFGAGEFHVEHV